MYLPCLWPHTSSNAKMAIVSVWVAICICIIEHNRHTFWSREVTTLSVWLKQWRLGSLNWEKPIAGIQKVCINPIHNTLYKAKMMRLIIIAFWSFLVKTVVLNLKRNSRTSRSIDQPNSSKWNKIIMICFVHYPGSRGPYSLNRYNKDENKQREEHSCEGLLIIREA